MAWPDWKGPSIPTEWDDVTATILWSALTTGVYFSLYRWEVLRTLARMPNHAKVNPSQRAMLSQAARRTNFISFSRGVGLVAGINPALTASLVVPVVAAGGWAATGELHGAVPPGTGMGMPMTPDLYTQGTSSNPAGWDFGSWWSNLF